MDVPGVCQSSWHVKLRVCLVTPIRIAAGVALGQAVRREGSSLREGGKEGARLVSDGCACTLLPVSQLTPAFTQLQLPAGRLAI